MNVFAETENMLTPHILALILNNSYKLFLSIVALKELYESQHNYLLYKFLNQYNHRHNIYTDVKYMITYHL